MLTAVVMLCALVWLPIVFYHARQRGLSILFFWLLIAPVASSLVNTLDTDPFSPTEVEQNSFSKPRESGYLSSRTTLRLSDLLEPTRNIFLIITVIFVLDIIFQRERTTAIDQVEIWMGIFSIILICSVLFQSNRLAFGLRVATDAFIVPFLGYFFARRLVTTEDRFHQLLRVMGYLGCYLIFLGLIEFLTQLSLQHRMRGPFRHRDLFYIVVMVTFFMVLLDLLRSRGLSREKRALSHAVQRFVLCLGPLVIFLTLTRGNWLGFALGMWVLLFLARRLFGFQQKVVFFGLILLLVPIIVMGIWAVIPEEFVRRAGQGNTISQRLLSWQIAIEEGIKQPIFGIGLNNLRNILGTITVRLAGVRNLGTLHNCYLAIFIELGLVGLIAYIAIIVSIMQMGLKLYRMPRQPGAHWCGVIVMAMLVAHFVPAFFSTILYVPAVSHVYVFVSLGAIAGVYHTRQPQRAVVSYQRPYMQRVPTFY